MTVTIKSDTAPANPTVPLLAIGYSAGRASRNIIHHVIGQESPSVTLRTAALRTGTLELLYPNEATAVAAETLHSRAVTLRLTDTDLASASMRYVVYGTVTRTLDPTTQVRWIVSVPFQEIA